MVDVVCGCGVSGGVETDVGELYSISTLAEMCLLGGESPRTSSLSSISIIRAGDLTGSLYPGSASSPGQ